MIEGSQRQPGADAPDHAAGHEHPALCVPGDAYNRIHWKSRRPPAGAPGQGVRARADRRRVDVPRPRSHGAHRRGDDSTIETAVRACCVDLRPGAAREPRGRPGRGRRRVARSCPWTAAARQHQKVMQLLAAVQADGTDAAARAARRGHLPRLRRGMTAVVDHAVAGSRLGAAAARPADARRGRTVVIADPLAHLERSLEAAGERLPRRQRARGVRQRAARRAPRARRTRAALPRLVPGTPLGDQIVTVGPRVAAGAR